MEEALKGGQFLPNILLWLFQLYKDPQKEKALCGGQLKAATKDGTEKSKIIIVRVC